MGILRLLIIKTKKSSFSNENTTFLQRQCKLIHPLPLASPAPFHPPPISVQGPSFGLRHIGTAQRTTIRMEWQFWAQVDLLATKAGRHWRELLEMELADKPVGHGAASWLRIKCLLLTKKDIHHGD